ncbi:DUF3071 domain-containing protein [Nocardioides mangrovicus]|uniref:DUF3071 domain-containing protein n=1 Tax=Nocardioides mangrovicus TaxID=2478913 RepID=A0A3L8P252_9ACTN|nr:septation protein SepH [Nocardioides mangrovicus]RLV49234.1 DUF3071 domain-containing protein [Nocardioides mangrovicus]
MRDLTPVRLTGGGKVLVLVDGHGEEYAVPIDDRLRETLGVSLQQAERQLTRKEPTVESTLRPRDIQSRIRAGESAEDVAAVAGTSVEKVMIFAGPVLAERAHVARNAQTASVRRRSGDAGGQVRTLGPAAAVRLREEGVDPESIEWDAWRREDGRWVLTAAYHHDAESRLARFVFDQPGHFVTAEDDEGRWLVGDGAARGRAATTEAAPEGLRLAPAPRAGVDAELGDDAIELVSHGDADWIASVPRQHVEPTVEHTVEPTVEVEPAAEEPADDASTTEPVAEEPAAQDEPPRPPTQLPRPESTPGRKNRRASVPSWDEIMFGGGRGE